jgi:hypothetical protein
MTNKQPFYHRCDGAVLFTATRPISEKEFIAALEKALKPLGLVKGSVEVEGFGGLAGGEITSGYMEPEPGDPADLL